MGLGRMYLHLPLLGLRISGSVWVKYIDMTEKKRRCNVASGVADTNKEHQLSTSLLPERYCFFFHAQVSHFS